MTIVDAGARQPYRLRGAPIIHDTIDNETIAINQLTGAYYSLEGPSALAWQMLADGATVAAIARRLADQYRADGSPIEQAVAAFLDELLAEELIVPTDAPANAEPAAVDADGHAGGEAAADSETFPGLRLQRYTDLEVMLLADPIHEVDDTGWPMPLADTKK